MRAHTVAAARVQAPGLWGQATGQHSTLRSFPCRTSNCTGTSGWSESCPPGPTSMDQQPAPGTRPGATSPGKGHGEAPDEVVDVLAKSIQLGACAGTNPTHVMPSLSRHQGC